MTNRSEEKDCEFYDETANKESSSGDVSGDTCRLYSALEGMGEHQGISTDLEIIGNIYENKELLESEE